MGTYHIGLPFFFLISEHFGCFHALFIVKNAAMNRSVKISLPECVFSSLGCSPSRVELLDLTVLGFLPACDRENVYILRYGELNLSYTRFSLNCV